MEERNAGVLPAPNGAGPSPIPAANTRRQYPPPIPAAGLAPPFLKVALKVAKKESLLMLRYNHKFPLQVWRHLF